MMHIIRHRPRSQCPDCAPIIPELRGARIDPGQARRDRLSLYVGIGMLAGVLASLLVYALIVAAAARP